MMKTNEEAIPWSNVLSDLDRSKTTYFFVIAALVAAMGGLTFGYDSGITGSALIYIKPYFHFLPVEVSLYLISFQY